MVNAVYSSPLFFHIGFAVLAISVLGYQVHLSAINIIYVTLCDISRIYDIQFF